MLALQEGHTVGWAGGSSTFIEVNGFEMGNVKREILKR